MGCLPCGLPDHVNLVVCQVGFVHFLQRTVVTTQQVRVCCALESYLVSWLFRLYLLNSQEEEGPVRRSSEMPHWGQGNRVELYCSHPFYVRGYSRVLASTVLY